MKKTKLALNLTSSYDNLLHLLPYMKNLQILKIFFFCYNLYVSNNIILKSIKLLVKTKSTKEID